MITLCFKDIFKNYEEFKAFTDELRLYESTDLMAEAFNQHIFYLLFNRYLDCSLAYETPDEFLAEFGIAYQQYFREFYMKKKMLDKIYSLKDEDLEILNESVNSFSNNPNYNTSDSWELLKFTSQQNRNRAKAGKFIAYLNALRQIPDAQVDALIKAFDYLWLDILSTDDIYLFNKEDK